MRDTIDMAREAGFNFDGMPYTVRGNHAQLAHLEALVRADERKQALAAQPAVQPVGYVAENGVVDWNVCAPPILTDLYTTPPAAQPAVPKLEPVHGDVLPPMGSRVYIRHGRDDNAHPCIVVGYYAWPDRHGNKSLHRVFVRVVYEGTDTQNARFLHECLPTPEAALTAHGITKGGAA
jgi:hypothetical protein